MDSAQEVRIIFNFSTALSAFCIGNNPAGIFKVTPFFLFLDL
jgi:hypothetical protein